MNQKVAWSMLVGGLVFFLGQLAELIAVHSTWVELTTPATAADFLRLMASVVPTVAGALGVVLPNKAEQEKRDQKEEAAIAERREPPPAALVFLLLLVLGTGVGCAGHRAPISVNPTATEIAQTQKDVIRAIEATTSALKIANVAVAAADELNKAKVLSNDVTKTIATAGLAFANTADLALQELEKVGTAPNLLATSKRLIGLLDPFLKTLEESKNEKLQAFAASLRIGMSIVRTIGG